MPSSDSCPPIGEDIPSDGHQGEHLNFHDEIMSRAAHELENMVMRRVANGLSTFPQRHIHEPSSRAVSRQNSPQLVQPSPVIGARLVEPNEEAKDIKVERVDSDDNELDGSLILSMERTLFSALNMAWTVIFLGIGFLTVGAQNDKLPDKVGVVIIICGVSFAGCSWFVHVARMRSFARGEGLGMNGSAAWTFCLTFLLVVAVAFELHFGLLHPYLKRAKEVNVV
eukprot:CAMPEP_0170621338 /NCGR_PEP_ID=MMETSP0224-20130122/28547_1 /TAXON_ID=285029 /ORGANISM="Togula jolla, Strain CCCM 725" /LENGTH=224 /DNA_ID=CAMNT_0010947589 /DNA_START=47 /DNA_END=721 /DNA_ORIENTATION=+